MGRRGDLRLRAMDRGRPAAEGGCTGLEREGQREKRKAVPMGVTGLDQLSGEPGLQAPALAALHTRTGHKCRMFRGDSPGE